MKPVVIENPILNKAAKTDTARTLWIPAVNNHGGFGRWAFLEIEDPWNMKNAVRKALGAASKKEAGKR